MHDHYGAASAAADLVTTYGRLAIELEEATDPDRQEWLHTRLAELDTTLDRAATSADTPLRETRP